MTTTPLGFTKRTPGAPETVDDATNWDHLDRLLQQMMQHRHNSVSGLDTTPPAAPAVEQLSSSGALPSGTTIYYRASVLDPDTGFESRASLSTWVTTSPALAIPNLTAEDIEVDATGGEMPAGVYVYSLSAWAGAPGFETVCGTPVVLQLPESDGNLQKVSISFPALPAGATGFNLYRKHHGSPEGWRVVSLTGEQSTPYVDDELDQIVMPPTAQPRANRSGYKRKVRVTRPTDVDPGATWRIYRTFHEEDGGWISSLIGETDAATFDDAGLAPDFASPVDAIATYLNPPPVRPPEIHAFPVLATLRASGVVALGGLEWVSPYDGVAIAAVHLSLDEGSTPADGELTADLEVWTGSTWDNIGLVSIDEDASAGSSGISSDPYPAGTRFRVNVTDIGDGTAENLLVQLQLWAKGAGEWFPVDWTP